jgi:preprotein translocase subunit SecY
MLTALRNAFRLPDLRAKLLFTLGILVVYRFAAHIPVPGVNQAALAQFFEGNVLGQLYNVLSGGALANFSIMAMGVYPYITASIIIQLLTPLIPQLEELSKEGEQGRNKINQYTNYLTVPLAFLTGLGQIAIMQQSGVFPDFGANLASLATLIALTAGTMFAVWLGQLITEQGVGNGVSIIIFGGILAGAPASIAQLWATDRRQLLIFILIIIFTVFVIVMIQEGQRRIPVKYSKQVRGRQVVGGQSSHVPLRVNASGMIPIIFAQSIIIFPGIVASYFTTVGNPAIADFATTVYDFFSAGSPVYWVAYFIMVVGFTFFYTDVIFRQQNLPETLRRQGGFIPGIRPGRPTETYLNTVMSRITFVGALYLGFIAILAWLVSLGVRPFGVTIDPANSTFIVNSVGLLIVVGVVLDTMKQLEAQLTMRHYEGFIRR